MFGPLGGTDPGNKAVEAQIERDVGRVAELLEGEEGRRMKDLAESCGGSWAPLRSDDDVQGTA